MVSADILKLSSELQRKSIHLGCSFLPLLYYFYLSREQIIAFSGIISIIFLSAEFLRFRFMRVQSLFSRLFVPLLRENEKGKTLTGATYLFLSATITFIVFEKKIAVPSVLVLTIADSLAAIVGTMTESVRFFRKSLAGSLAFLVSGTVIIWLLVPGIRYVSLFVVIPVTVMEAAVVKVNDNILIPFSTGLILHLIMR
jgi:dolichol kinase